jgi:hypothetical protein
MEVDDTDPTRRNVKKRQRAREVKRRGIVNKREGTVEVETSQIVEPLSVGDDRRL